VPLVHRQAEPRWAAPASARSNYLRRPRLLPPPASASLRWLGLLGWRLPLGALALASAPWLLFCGATILLRTGAMNKIPQAPADSIVLDASELKQHVEEIAGEPNTDVAAERHAAGLPQDVEDEEVEEAEEVGNLAAGMMTSTSVLPQIAEEIVMNPASTRQQGSLP